MAEMVAKLKTLIRRPAREVFNAFVDPGVITKFWLKGTTGPLAPGARVEWQFMVPGASEWVHVTAFDGPGHLAFAWTGSGLGVDIRFLEKEPGITVVDVEVRGFASDAGMDPLVDVTEGFSIVLCDLKVLLESGRSPGLVKDKAALIQGARNEP